MNNSRLVLRSVELSGWVLGLAAATWGNYRALPWLALRLHGKLPAIAVGFVGGVVLLYLCVEGAWRSAEVLRAREEAVKPIRVRRPKTDAERLPLSSRIIIALVGLLVASGMVVSQLPTLTSR